MNVRRKSDGGMLFERRAAATPRITGQKAAILRRENVDSALMASPIRCRRPMAVALLNRKAPVSIRVRESAIARVDARVSPVAPSGTVARLAYEFVRGQIDSVRALVRVLRGGLHRSTAGREEERW